MSRSPAGERRHREAGRGGDRRRSRSRSRSRDRERRRRDGRSPERRRDDGRLEDRGRGRSGSPGRRGNRREERNGGGGGGRERPAAEDVSRQAAEATAQAAPPKREAVFEVSKDGKVRNFLNMCKVSSALTRDHEHNAPSGHMDRDTKLPAFFGRGRPGHSSFADVGGHIQGDPWQRFKA